MHIENGQILRTELVPIGSGMKICENAADKIFLSWLKFDSAKQLVPTEFSGALLLAKLDLLERMPAPKNAVTKPLVFKAEAKEKGENACWAANLTRLYLALSS